MERWSSAAAASSLALAQASAAYSRRANGEAHRGDARSRDHARESRRAATRHADARAGCRRPLADDDVTETDILVDAHDGAWLGRGRRRFGRRGSSR